MCECIISVLNRNHSQETTQIISELKFNDIPSRRPVWQHSAQTEACSSRHECKCVSADPCVTQPADPRGDELKPVLSNSFKNIYFKNLNNYIMPEYFIMNLLFKTDILRFLNQNIKYIRLH